MGRETLGTKLSDIEKKLGGTGEMPPAGTYDPLLWHLDRIESLIGGGSQSWSPYKLSYTFDEIYDAVKNEDLEAQEPIKNEIHGIIFDELGFMGEHYIEFSTKDGCVFKISACIGTSWATAFKGDKRVIVECNYEIDAETGNYMVSIGSLYIEL